MGKNTLVIALGVFTAILPFLGFPASWDRFFFIVAGLGVVVLGALIRRDYQSGNARVASASTYVDHEPDTQSELSEAHSENRHEAPIQQ